MFKPSHSEKKFTAKRVFAGRQDEQASFRAACDEDDTQELYKVLMWYGVGGQGKSTLLSELVRLADAFNEDQKKAKSKKRLASAKIDFDDERLKRIDNALYSIRLQLAQKSGFAFHAFDAAFVSYYKKTRPGVDIAATFPELFGGEKEGLVDLIDILEGPATLVAEMAAAAIPGANLLYKWGARLTGKLKKWWDTRGKDILVGIEAMPPEELLQRLPSFLGADICDGIKSKSHIRPLIILDTYEALWKDRGQRDALADRRADEWVRLLIQDAPGTLFVIAGRDQLRWGEIEPAWDEVVTAELLGGLSDEGAEHFLHEVPIDDDAIRSVIIESSQGLPFYLDLQVSHYESLLDQNIEATVDQFGGTPSDILARFLDHLNDADQSLLRLASYLQTITKPVMAALVEAFPGRALNYSFDTMVARSSYTETSEGTYEIHALMKEELQRREQLEDEQQYKNVHQKLFEYYENLFDSDLEHSSDWSELVTDFLKVFHHSKEVSAKLSSVWLLQNGTYLEYLTEWEILISLYEEAERKLGDKHDDHHCIFLLNYAYILSISENISEAISIIAKAEKIAHHAPSKLLLFSVIDYRKAHICRINDQFEKSNQLIASSIKNITSKSELTDEQSAYLNFANGDTLLKIGQFNEAAECFLKAARKIYSANSSDLQSAILHYYAETLHFQDKPQVAIQVFRNALCKFTFGPSITSRKTSDSIQHSFSEFLPLKWKIENSGARLRKTLFYKLPFFFNTHDSTEFWHLGNPKVLADLKTDFSDILQQPLTTHPDKQLIIKYLKQELSKTKIEIGLLDFALSDNIKLEFFEDDNYLDFGYNISNKLVWFTFPKVISKLHVLVFIFEMRRVAQIIGGVPQPDASSSILDFASHLHASNVDCLYELCRFINSHRDEYNDDFNDYLSSLNPLLAPMVEEIYRDLPIDEAYGLYADFVDSLNP